MLLMTDTLSKTERSERMARVRGKDTKPELLLRSLVHGMGYRYRLHQKGLPGKPDIVFSSRRKVIFMHGCFWHRHDDPACKLARLPKSRSEFWLPKLEGNQVRDKRNIEALEQLGWASLVVWECQMRSPELVGKRVRAFLDAK